jgi:hypothetical protein
VTFDNPSTFQEQKMSSSEVPSKEAIRSDLQRRLESVRQRLKEFDALREESRALEAALAALGGDSSSSAEPDSPVLKQERRRATREEVQARRDKVAEMLAENPDLSINDVAEAVDVSYQSAANDIRLIQESGQSLQ